MFVKVNRTSNVVSVKFVKTERTGNESSMIWSDVTQTDHKILEKVILCQVSVANDSSFRSYWKCIQ